MKPDRRYTPEEEAYLLDFLSHEVARLELEASTEVDADAVGVNSRWVLIGLAEDYRAEGRIVREAMVHGALREHLHFGPEVIFGHV